MLQRRMFRATLLELAISIGCFFYRSYDNALWWFVGALLVGSFWYFLRWRSNRYLPRFKYTPPQTTPPDPKPRRPQMSDPRSNRLIIPPSHNK